MQVVEARQFLHKTYKIAAPYPSPPPKDDVKYKLEYAAPANINVVGSYVSRTMVKADSLRIDMVVVMPSSIFQEKDYLNYRYFYKRAFYLACIAGALRDIVHDEFALSYRYLNDNDLHPVLVVKPVRKNSSTFEINIIPSAPQDAFTQMKLRPSKNSIRSTDVAEIDSLAPTPFYNASLQADLNYLAYLKRFHAVSKQCDEYKDACILGRIWLRQRGFSSSILHGGFGHFEWAATTALLLEGGGPKGQSILSPGYSSYQIFKAVLQFLSTTNLVAKPLVNKADDFSGIKSESPLLFDGPRNQNLLFKMSAWSYELLKHEATSSLAMLNDNAFDQFESTFITLTAQSLQRFDCIVKTDVPSVAAARSADHSTRVSNFCFKLYSLLREGLGDRVKLIDIQRPAQSAWPTKNAHPEATEEDKISVCVLFDPTNIDRIVDHGPSAEDKKAAAKFQKFWGEKAELRRFKDGSILESLVWSAGTSYSIFQEIFTYLIQQHFPTSISSGLTFIGEGFDKLIPNHNSGKKAFDELRTAFGHLERTIRDLEGLPLQLRQLSPISSNLRNSSLDVPIFSPSSPLTTPADVVIQFEGSGRWPDDVVAIQRTKIAFLLKTADLMGEADDSITTRVGIEHEDDVLQNCAYLEVIYESGAVFRLRIHTEREQSLLERIIKDKSTPGHTREEAVLALAELKRVAVQLPLHHQSIATHCTRFPHLGPTIRLVKNWLSKHMLLGHISEEFAELLAIRTFLQPYPWTAPSSAMTGFLRTLLWISKWDWRQAPLIVDFNGTMTNADVTNINTRLEAWRKIDPAMNRTVLVAASNHDTTGTAFTANGPTKMVAARLTALARSACRVVKDQGINIDPKSLFASSISDYDFVVHISPKFAGKKQKKEVSKQKFKNLEIQSESNHESVGFNSVKLYLKELTELYNDCIVFFHSESTGNVIAGLWNPQTMVNRSFRVNLGYASKIVGDVEEEKVTLDKSSILSEISRLGGDLISKIEVNR